MIKNRFGAEQKIFSGEGIKVTYYESKKSICSVWNQERISEVIEHAGGTVLKMDTVRTHDDAGNPMDVIVTVAKNKKIEGKKV